MNFQDCIKFAMENPVAWIATIEGDQPRVRAFSMWFADDTGFYFHTGAPKGVCRQLQKNPKIEVAFHKPDNMAGTMLRVTGKVEFCQDLALKKRLIKEKPFLSQMGFTAEHPDLVVFKIAQGEACFWTFQTDREPKKPMAFGR